MKQELHFLNGIDDKTSEDFKDKLLALLPAAVEAVLLDDFGICPKDDGSYSFYLELYINDEPITLVSPFFLKEKLSFSEHSTYNENIQKMENSILYLLKDNLKNIEAFLKQIESI